MTTLEAARSAILPALALPVLFAGGAGEGFFSVARDTWLHLALIRHPVSYVVTPIIGVTFCGRWLLPVIALTFAVLFCLQIGPRVMTRRIVVGVFLFGFCVGFLIHFANPNQQVMLP